MRGLRGWLLVTCLGLVVVSIPVAAQAQGTWGIGGSAGMAIPMGDFSDAFNSGFDGSVFFDYGVTNEIAIGFDVGGNFQTASDDFKTALNNVTVALLLFGGATTATADLEPKVSALRFCVHGRWMPAAGSARPFIQAGGGIYNLTTKLKGRVTIDGVPFDVDESDSESKAGLNAGAGVMFATSAAYAFGVRGEFHNIFTSDSSTQFFTVAAVFEFLGGGTH